MRIQIKIVCQNNLFKVYRWERFDAVLLAEFATLEEAACFKNSL
jgi:hypothetical protein